MQEKPTVEESSVSSKQQKHISKSLPKTHPKKYMSVVRGEYQLKKLGKPGINHKNRCKEPVQANKNVIRAASNCEQRKPVKCDKYTIGKLPNMFQTIIQ